MAGITVGVEEEFLLVDPATGVPVPRAEAVLESARGGLRHLPQGAAVQAELWPTQVEAATGICRTSSQLRSHLEAGRRALAAGAEAYGLALVATGTPLLSPPVRSGSAGERFAGIHRRYAGVVADYQACGCHVHVGVEDPDLAVAVVNHLHRWLPSLLALSVNSPFDRGLDTGYGSWRMVQQSRFPGAGIPPLFADFTHYRRLVSRLVGAGVLADDAMTFWLVRPSVKFPTVEFRVADTAGTASEAVLFALISRALVGTAALAVQRGEKPPPVDPQIGAAAVWSAARYGLSGPAVDPLDGRQRAATELVAEMLAYVRDALVDLGDYQTVVDLLDGLRRTGTGADRQRAAFDGGVGPLVALLRDQTHGGLIEAESRVSRANDRTGCP